MSCCVGASICPQAAQEYWPELAKTFLQLPALILGTLESLHPSCFSLTFSIPERWPGGLAAA